MLPLPLLLLSLVSLATADSECTVTAADGYYDLTPLKAAKDYQVQANKRTFYLNVCRPVVDAVWNVKDVPDASKVGARFRADHGDFSMG